MCVVIAVDPGLHRRRLASGRSSSMLRPAPSNWRGVLHALCAARARITRTDSELHRRPQCVVYCRPHAVRWRRSGLSSQLGGRSSVGAGEPARPMLRKGTPGFKALVCGRPLTHVATRSRPAASSRSLTSDRPPGSYRLIQNTPARTGSPRTLGRLHDCRPPSRSPHRSNETGPRPGANSLGHGSAHHVPKPERGDCARAKDSGPSKPRRRR